jgi:hypothetical protein
MRPQPYFATLADIEGFVAAKTDGETLSFELKGTNNRSEFVSDDKNRLAKEMCAFANTYGGVVCFHFGSDDAVEPFPASDRPKIFRSLESWLKDALEPKLSGIDLESIDGVYLIRVPPSTVKPHRSAREKNQYYYRHVSQSTPMPEIMISSMYRSQSFLDFTATASLSKSGSQLHIHAHVKNNSNLSGTHPKIQVQIWTDGQKSGKFFGNLVEEPGSASYKTSGLAHVLGLGLATAFTSGTMLAQSILYPQDTLSLTAFSSPEFGEIRYAVMRVDAMCKEAPRQTVHYLFDLDAQSTSTVLKTGTSDADVNSIFAEFIARSRGAKVS